MISIEVDDRSVLAALRQLSSKSSNLANVLADIGEHLTETTKRRFDTSTAPDGTKWAPNTQTTILQHLGAYKGSYTKAGKISSKGISRVTSKKPLIGETRSLSSTINYLVNGNQSVEIGSPMIYSAMHQFGGHKTDYPNLWGNIPARPFLGLSDDDRRNILDILAEYLTP